MQLNSKGYILQNLQNVNYFSKIRGDKTFEQNEDV